MTNLINILASAKICQNLCEAYSETELIHIFKIFIEKITKISYSNLSMLTEFQLNLEQQHVLDIWTEKLKNNQPFQQIVGETDFLNMVLKVNEYCLIPRPETEDLVLEALKYMNQKDSYKVLDIGTGSGCIAISIKKNRPLTQVFGLDIHNQTLQLMSENAQTQDCKITCIQQNFLHEPNWLMLPQFNFIISNPPYIPIFKKTKLSKRVLDFEPHQALFVPDNKPLIFYEKIIDFASTHLNNKGYIFVEFEQDFASQIFDLFNTNNYITEIKKDRFFCDRILIAHKKNVPLPK